MIGAVAGAGAGASAGAGAAAGSSAGSAAASQAGKEAGKSGMSSGGGGGSSFGAGNIAKWAQANPNITGLNMTIPTENKFYGHSTVPSCRKDATITGAGDVFNKTKEDKAFSRSSNFSTARGTNKKAR